MTRRTMTMFVAAAALLAGGCGGDDGNGADRAAGNASASAAGGSGQAGETLGQAIGRTAGLGAFAGAVKTAGLEGVLNSASAYTIFAPNDAAFAGAGVAGADVTGADRAKLAALIRGHIVPGVVTSDDLEAAIDKGKGRARLATLSGTTLTARREGKAILVSGASGGEARVVQADLAGSNGVAHVVDGMLAR